MAEKDQLEEEQKKPTKQELLSLAEQNDMIVPKNMSDTIFNTLNNYQSEGSLSLPAHFSPANALKSAWLIIQDTLDKNNKPALEVCTTDSIANALLETCILGLNPAKKQCYYIVYDTKLSMMPSYFGKQTALKRVAGVEAINANVIYKGDGFTYDIRKDGSIYNLEHKQDFLNIDEDNITGGYATVTFKGEVHAVVQSYAQIVNAWKGAKGYGKEKKTFKAEFTKRTMINLVVKHFLQTTDDSDLLPSTMIQNEDQHYEFSKEDVVETQETVIDQKFEEPTTTEKIIPDHNESTGEIVVEEPVIEKPISKEAVKTSEMHTNKRTLQ